MSQESPQEIALDPTRRYHFVGIGGSGMSSIARILLARGMRVSGSDAKPSAMLTHLEQLGAQVAVGHDARHLTREDVLVLSDAIKPENPEWRQAVEWALPIIKRADLLGALTNCGRGVAVSGTHGKTTTSGMLTMIFLEAGMDPTSILGGELAPLGGNARPGGALTVVEACEAYNSFLNLRPEAAIVTNIEVDHLDFHGTPEHLFDSFRQFLRQVRGFAMLNGDDPLLRSMTTLPPRALTYGVGVDNDYRIVGVDLARRAFTLLHDNEDLGTFTVQVPGIHNMYNAAGAAALALEMGANLAAVRRGLAAFPGMHRRFEILGVRQGVTVVDDYAHHPTEIRATLSAARVAYPGTLVALFQPHLFSRTRDLLEEFAQAFDKADVIMIPPIFPSREAPIPGVSHEQLVARLRELHPHKPVIGLSSLDEGVALLTHAIAQARRPKHSSPMPALRSGDVIITIGAGDVDAVAHALVDGTLHV